jgi:hypothetical protein
MQRVGARPTYTLSQPHKAAKPGMIREMSEDAPPLLMTPQLQLAVRLLATPSGELAGVLGEHGLRVLLPGETDPYDVIEQQAALEDERDPWFPLDAHPLPTLGSAPDVWIAGNPPVARANGAAYPRLVASTSDRQGLWLVRALRQRAKTYESVIAAVLALRPALATTVDPESLAAVTVDELAEAVGMHASTVTRVASAVRFQNLHAVLQLQPVSRSRLAFARA